MAKIKVKVKPGQILYTIDKTYKAGDELLMEEKDAEPILGTCISKVSKKKKKPKPKFKLNVEEIEITEDEKETI